MESDWQIAGHKKQIEILQNSIKTGRLSHAYVFAGPMQVGKRTVAFKFAQSLLCEQQTACGKCAQCKVFKALANADFLYLSGIDGIKIDQIRDLGFKLSLKAYLAQYKVAVIDDAENMTVEASNALLKLLEEPKPKTIIILITSNPYKLLRTISSRAQKINFGAVNTAEYEHYLGNLNPEQKQTVLLASTGRPGLALAIAADENFLKMLNESDTQFAQFVSGDLIARLKLAAEVADLEAKQIKEIIENWIVRLEKNMVANPQQNMVDKIRQLLGARRFLDQNVNAKLLLSNLMIKTQI